MPVADIDGTEFYYEIEGEGDWMVFAHGGGGTHLDWWRQVYDFRGRYRCLTYDLRGLGQSRGEEDYSAAGSDLVALMDRLGIERAILNGHSAGGWAASHVAQRHPERVRALIMTSTPFGFFVPALSAWADEMLGLLQGDFAVWDHMYSDHFKATQPQSHFLYAALGRLNARLQVRGPDYVERFEAAYRGMRDAPVQDYSAFSTPSLFIVGGADAMITPRLIRGVAEAVPGAAMVEIPQAGHYLPAEQPQAYAEAVSTFLAGL